MEVTFSDNFKKIFKKRITSANTEELFWYKLEIFVNNPFEQSLKTHKLSGKLKGLSSFSVEYDVRVVFYFTKDKPTKAIFIDIGNHDEDY
ncbi:MAG: type II toxin-antitoxin system mRNA interferase toxin, RelE/StbE family [Deinococcales bacterium]|nr:type II toxin-antitoxin system mRNA interferase toxin, RelE/StbE family [Chitinophagaceae bacterium]